MKRPTVFWRYTRALFRALAPALALLLALTACSSIRPFGKGANAGSGDAPPLLITGIDGASAQDTKRLSDALYRAAMARGIAPARKRGQTAKAVRLAGAVSATATAEGMAAAYAWDISGPGIRFPHRISGQRRVETGAAQKLPDETVRRIAGDTMERLALWLERRGHVLREHSLPPPSFAGLHAPLPGTAAYRAQFSGNPESGKPKDGNSETYARLIAASPHVDSLTTASIPPSRIPASIVPVGATRHGAAGRIAVAPLVSTPARANDGLRTGLERALEREGAPVVRDAAGPNYLIDADIAVSPPARGRQSVDMLWRLRAPDGSIVGTVRQNSKVPAGSLARGWGAAGDAATTAAAKALAGLWAARENAR